MEHNKIGIGLPFLLYGEFFSLYSIQFMIQFIYV